MRPFRRTAPLAVRLSRQFLHVPRALRPALMAARFRALLLRALALARAPSGRHMERAVLGADAGLDEDGGTGGEGGDTSLNASGLDASGLSPPPPTPPTAGVPEAVG